MGTQSARLFLLRHGEVEDRWRGTIYGNLDVALSPRGEEEARAAAERIPIEPALRPSIVVSSDLERARFGADRIAERVGVQRLEDPDLAEIDRGDWAGKSVGEIDARFPGARQAWYRAPRSTRPPGGESLEDLARRVLPALDRWAERASGGSVAIVAHLWVLRTAACGALGLDLDRAGRLDIPTGELLVLDWPVHVRANPGPRPTLAGFAVENAPRGRGWFRGPHRSPR